MNRQHSAISTTPGLKKQSARNTQRGFILMTVVVAITLVAAIAFVLNYEGASETNITTGELERDQLRYVAEAGMAHARLQLTQNTSCSGYTDIPKTDFGVDSYSATFDTNKDSPVTVKATGQLLGGAEVTLQSDAIRAYQPPIAVILQLGKAAGKDVHIDSFYPNANYGSIDDLVVRSSSSWIQRPLLEFDLSAIPPAASIISATLELEQRIIGTPGVIGVHRVTRSWEEGTGKGTGNADGATWNEYDGASAWAAPGGDFASTLYATAATTSGKNGQWVAWDVRDLVDEWVSGQFPNYGLMLVGDGVVDNAEFESREELNTASAPKLTIAYACECGKVCGGAAPGKNVLLVVGDTTNLLPEQADKKALMEGWGHNVALIATSESQAAFDTAAGTVDVVYIPELTAGPMGELDTKADDLALGVITEEARTALLLGSWAVWPFVDADSINITDNTHYITETLPTGNVLLSTAVQSMWVLQDTLAVDLHVLGQLGGTSPGLAYLDKDELRNDSTPAPGRRVKLPWGSFDFDVNLLTTDALEIMQRAIEWGASGTNSCASTSPLMFVVGDETALTTQEVARQTLLESWCYAVKRIDDGASQAEYDADVAIADIAYVSSEALASQVSTKLKPKTIGIVNENPGLHNDFGFSTVRYQGSTNAPLTTDAAHYITSPFAGSDVTLFTSVQPSGAAVGTLPAGLLSLGDWTSGDLAPLDGLLTLDTGAAISGGGTAAGRRVQMPWDGVDGTSAADIDALSADGQTILQRSLEWAAGLDTSTGPIAHWKLDDGVGTTAIDSEGGHDGTLVNGPGWGIGTIGGGLDFDGLDDSINAGSAETILDIFDGGGTLTAWFRPVGWGEGNYGRIADKSSATYPGNGWALELYGANASFLFQVGFSSATGSWITPNGSVSLDAWQHVALVYDNSSDANDPVIYIDGTPQAVSELDTPSGTLRSDAGINLTLGNHAMAATRTFDGTLDDIRIYDYMLDATDIAELASAGGGGGGGGGGGCSATYADDLTSGDYTGSTGTLPWATDWLEINESDGSNKGDEIVGSGANAALRVRDNDGGGEGIRREADVSGFSSATLSFAYTREVLDNADDYVTVDVSADGGANWSEIDRFAGPADDAAPLPTSYDISGHIAPNTQIRFLSSSTLGQNDRVFFYDIQICLN